MKNFVLVIIITFVLSSCDTGKSKNDLLESENKKVEKTYYSNGKLKEIYETVNDTPNGRIIRYDEAGNKYSFRSVSALPRHYYQ